MMTLDHLIDRYMEAQEQTSTSKAALGNLSRFASQSKIDFTEYTTDTWKEFFYSARAALLSLRKYRMSLVAFYEWVISNAGITSAQSALEALKAVPITHTKEHDVFNGEGYFANYASMIGQLECALSDGGSNYASAPALKAMFTLVWFGVPWQEALNIRKDQIVYEADSFNIRGVVKIRNRLAIRHLVDYYNRESTKGLSGSTYTYKESEWLFRSSRSPHISETSLNNMVKALNHASRGFFSFDRVRTSAIYLKTFTIVSNMGYVITNTPPNDLIPALPRIMELNTAQSGDIRRIRFAWQEFYAWCKFFRLDAEQ